MSPDVPGQCQVEQTWSVVPSCPYRVLELWWLCVLRVVLGMDVWVPAENQSILPQL